MSEKRLFEHYSEMIAPFCGFCSGKDLKGQQDKVQDLPTDFRCKIRLTGSEV
jgi:hypothetical protein